MLVAAADPSMPSHCPCQVSRMGNLFDAGGKLKFGPGDAPPAALCCIRVNLGATRRDKAAHSSPEARGRTWVLAWFIRSLLPYQQRGMVDTQLGDRGNITANPGKVSEGVLSIKKLRGVVRVLGHHSGPYGC